MTFAQENDKVTFRKFDKRKRKKSIQKDARPPKLLPTHNFILESGASVCAQELLLEDHLAITTSATSSKIASCSAEYVSIGEHKVAQEYFTNQDYFSIWDTKNVNPYGKITVAAGTEIKLKLYDVGIAGSWSYPIARDKITSKYGFRRYRFHHGTDIKLDVGDPVQVVFDGVVRMAKYDHSGYGYYVMVRHKNGIETLYGHLSQYFVMEGQAVKAGEIVGLGGNTGRSTGPHLHFETRYAGISFDPAILFDFKHFSTIPYHFIVPLKKSARVKIAKHHYVRRGESLWKISKRYQTSIGVICRLNNMPKSRVLRPGMRLRVR